MASILLENVTLDFPIYGVRRSFRKELFRAATGGVILRNAQERRVTVRALDTISLLIEHGDRIGLIGHNGAGKSTLLRVLAGVYSPSQGRIAMDGRVSPLFTAAPGMD